MSTSILLVDDCADEMKSMCETWGEWTHIPLTWRYATNGDVALGIIAHEHIDLVLMDGHLVDERGHEVVSRMRAQGIGTPVVMFSSDNEENEKGMLAGAQYAVDKAAFCDEWIGEPSSAMDALAAIVILVAVT